MFLFKYKTWFSYNIIINTMSPCHVSRITIRHARKISQKPVFWNTAYPADGNLTAYNIHTAPTTLDSSTTNKTSTLHNSKK